MDRIVNVLDFLADELGDPMNRSAICESYYDMYCANDDEFQHECKLQGMNPDEIRTKTIRRLGIAMSDWLSQISDITPVIEGDGGIIVVSKTYDIDLVDNPAPYDDSDTYLPVPVMSYDVTLAKYDEVPNIPKYLADNPHASTPDELFAWKGDREIAFQTYAFEFDEMRVMLGYDVAVPTFFSKKHECEFTSALISEMTFFGWDVLDADEDKGKMIDELTERVDECRRLLGETDVEDSEGTPSADGDDDSGNSGTASCMSFDEMLERHGIKPKTRPVRDRNKTIEDGIYVLMYNNALEEYGWLYNLIQSKNMTRAGGQRHGKEEEQAKAQQEAPHAGAR